MLKCLGGSQTNYTFPQFMNTWTSGSWNIIQTICILLSSLLSSTCSASSSHFGHTWPPENDSWDSPRACCRWCWLSSPAEQQLYISFSFTTTPPWPWLSNISTLGIVVCSISFTKHYQVNQEYQEYQDESKLLHESKVSIPLSAAVLLTFPFPIFLSSSNDDGNFQQQSLRNSWSSQRF